MNWWMHSASNGHSNKRHITKGDGRVLTNDELRDDAMKISQRHIHLFIECAEFKQEKEFKDEEYNIN